MIVAIMLFTASKQLLLSQHKQKDVGHTMHDWSFTSSVSRGLACIERASRRGSLGFHHTQRSPQKKSTSFLFCGPFHCIQIICEAASTQCMEQYDGQCWPMMLWYRNKRRRHSAYEPQGLSVNLPVNEGAIHMNWL